MLPGLELMGCADLAVPTEVMHHVVRIESSYNPFAIGVVGGRLVRQPRNLPEAVATAKMLESRGFNFSLGLAQVNRYNLKKYGIVSYETAFQTCPNLSAGSRILAECYSRSKGDWGDSLSCYYSGNFVTGYRHGYVQKVFASMGNTTRTADSGALAIEVTSRVGRSASEGATQPRSASSNAPGARPGLVSLRSAATPPSRSSSTRQPEPAALDEVSTQRGPMPQQPTRAGDLEAPFQARQAAPASESAAITQQANASQGARENQATTDSAFVF